MTRSVGFAIDAMILVLFHLVVLGAVTAVISALTTNVNADKWEVLAALTGLGFVAGAYFVLMWTLAGETIGMRIVGIRVESTRGGRPKPRQSLARLLGMVIAAIPFFAGYLLILVDNRRQGLHDKLGRTVVLYKAKEVPALSASVNLARSPATEPREIAVVQGQIMNSFQEGQKVWVHEPDGSAREAVFVGEAANTAVFGGRPMAHVVFTDTRSGAEVELDRVTPREG